MKNEQLIRIMLREALGKIQIVSEMVPMKNTIFYESIETIIESIDDMVDEIKRLNEEK